ncbi:MAG: VWA domain-containing protein [Thermoanaerobaculia bacterium]|nr:VWA domain-containing protein [Thermoanaerobaculia bacterium]
MSWSALSFLAPLSLERPACLLLLLLLPLHVMLRVRAESRQRTIYPPLQFTAHRKIRSDRPWLVLQLALEVLLLAVVVLGLTGLHRIDEVERWTGEGIDIALVMDVSLSMLADDFPPDRITAMRRLADRFLARSGGHRVALVVFAKDVYLQSPPTMDRHVLQSLLDGVRVDGLNQAASGGTAIGDALLVAAQTLDEVREPERDQAVVILTDGESNLGVEPSWAARYLKHLGQRLYAIGVGGTEPVQVTYFGELVGGGDDPYLAVLDDTELQRTVDAADGKYFRALDVDALEKVFSELSRLESAPLERRTVRVKSSLSHGPALLALPLWWIVLWLGGMIRRRPYR